MSNWCTKEFVERVISGEEDSAKLIFHEYCKGSQYEGFKKIYVVFHGEPSISHATPFIICSCGNLYSGTGGHIKRHRELCVGKAKEKEADMPMKKPLTTPESICLRIAQLCAECLIPMSKIADEKWRKFFVDFLQLGSLLPADANIESFIPSRPTLRAAIDSYCCEVVEEISEVVHERMEPKMINGMADFGRVYDDFMILKGSFIREEMTDEGPIWKLQVLPLAVFPVPIGKKSADRIGPMMITALERYSITEDSLRSFIFTADGGANIKKACEDFTAGYVRCLSHLTDILAKRIVKPYERPALQAEDQIVVEKYRNLLDKSAELIRLFKKDKTLCAAIQISLKSPVQTRWFSQFDAAESVFENMNVLAGNTSLMSEELEKLVLELNESTERQRWKLLKTMVADLRVMNKLSQKNDVQLHLVMPFLVKFLKLHAANAQSGGDLGALSRSAVIAVKNNLSDLHSYHYLAAALNPPKKCLRTHQDTLDENQVPIDIESEVNVGLQRIASILGIRDNSGGSSSPSSPPSPSQNSIGTSLLLQEVLDSTPHQNCETLSEEFNRYMASPTSLCPQRFWPQSALNYPKLTAIARKVLASPSSEADVERSFSILKQLRTPSRLTLNLDLLEKIMLVKELDKVVRSTS